MPVQTMLDGIFFEISNLMRQWPSLLISLVSILICDTAVVLARRYFGIVGLCCCMVVFNIVGNVQVLYATAYELINLPVLLGTTTLSASFLACDMANEYFGAKKARRIVLCGFLCQILFFINIILTIGHRPIDLSIFSNFSMSQGEIDGNIAAIERVFLPLPRLLIASYIAYLTSQLFEIWTYRAVKRIRFIGSDYIKHNISLFLSTVIVDTLMFTGIALVLLAPDPLSLQSFLEIFSSACIIRIVCNVINSFVMKVELARSSKSHLI